MNNERLLSEYDEATLKMDRSPGPAWREAWDARQRLRAEILRRMAGPDQIVVNPAELMSVAKAIISIIPADAVPNEYAE